MRRLLLPPAVGAAVCAAAAPPAAAQQAPNTPPEARPEILRGRVAADSAGTPLPGATVTVTRGPDREVRTATAGADGRWQVAFANGTGDYLVGVTVIGRSPVRRRVTRGAPGFPAVGSRDSVYTVDVVLAARVVAQLSEVKVQGKAPRPERRGDAFIGERGPGAAEEVASGVAGAVSPDLAGDLAALAGTTPGVTLTPGGVSALGLGAGQTNVTLGGLAFPGADLPRGARTATRVRTSSYDPAVGWFGGAQVAVELERGWEFSQRTAHVTADAPQLQAADPAAAGLGQRARALQVSGGGTGAVRDGRWTYNASGQLARRAQDAPGLLTARADALAAAGVAPDSAARLAALARAAGIPLGAAGAWSPGERLSDQASFALRLDTRAYDPQTFDPLPTSYGVTAFGSLRRGSALGVGPSAAVTRGGTSGGGTAGAQAVYSRFLGRRGTQLLELRTGLSATDAESSPYLRLPGATVLVGSAASPNDAAAEGDAGPALSTLALGGNAGLATRRRTALWETQAEWRVAPARRAKHRPALTADLRLDRLNESPGADRLGTYGYQSLDDLAAGRAATFARTLGAPDRAASAWNGFIAFGDYWRASDRLQVLYGARLEGNAFATRPAANPALRQALGVDTRRAPNTAALSPRLGVSWQPARRKPGGAGIQFNNFGVFPMRPRGILRAGVGQFRNLLGPDLVAQAAGATGLPGAAQRLLCVGPAVPAPDWAAWAAGASSFPGACAGGAGAALADTAPAVLAFAPGYTAPSSWRANVGWNSAWKRLAYGVDAVASLNVNQPGTVDANFAGAPRFALAGEGRPVYVAPGAIDPATGALSPAGARTSAAFGRVALQASDLRSLSRQATVTLAPTEGGFGNYKKGRYLISGAYTVGNVRQQQRGFDGSAFGDPRAREWARGDLDVRHQFLVQGGYSRRGVTLTLLGRVQSGLPFTPLVGSDVNGDGLANDRAAVVAPAAAAAAGDPALAAGTRALLDGAPGPARRCLARALGAAAARNACEGPWTAALNARLGYNRPLPRVGRRVNLALNLANPLGGLDQLVNGRNVRGWGAPAAPDPVLYQVRGFDADARRFRYAVNPRFGRTHAGAAGLRPPFRLTLDLTLDLGRSIPEQQLDKWLRPGRAGRPGARLTADDLRRRYGRNVPDPYARILSESDSLLLTREQAEAVTAAQGRYQRAMDSVWTPLVEHLAALPDRFDAAAVLKQQEAAVDSAWERSRLHVQAELPRVLSPTQLGLLPWPADMLWRSKEPMKGVRVFISGN